MLTLAIRRKWFNMILSGEKTEEYRKINPYYQTRFNNLFGLIIVDGLSIPSPLPELKKDGIQEIVFRNGYSKNSPSFVARCSLKIGTGNPEWGAEPNEEYYVLKILEIKEVSS